MRFKKEVEESILTELVIPKYIYSPLVIRRCLDMYGIYDRSFKYLWKVFI